MKRAAKTIMLHNCDVENCEHTSATMVEKGEILSFHMTTFVLFLSDEDHTNCNFHRILITETQHS